ncbi:hypothetical protein KFV02_04460 [Desulfohalobiaceae bacterium Ax17]|uniref:hypothetical protein n=1 Tax=Desulfovulcanus ferrireducens TaxID=2831190 RepID=UPI00207BA527|nr:hypothetical protein [Desulfovulcanus ferrireducens]MBT8763180.1 hypothetical protein [Desulfovulcanus ferrireducens]
MKSLQVFSRITISIFCIAASIVLYKVEVLDHQWITFNRDINGYVNGWYTPEDAITKGRWNTNDWDFEILSRDSFKVRKHVNPITCYLIPLTFLYGAVVVFVPSKK